MEYGSVAAKRGRRLAVRRDQGRTVRDFPLDLIQSITLFTGTHITTGLQAWCFANRLPVVYLNRAGGLQWLVFPGARNGVKLRCRQYAVFTDPVKRLELAGKVVAAKIENGRRLLLEKGVTDRGPAAYRNAGSRALTAPSVATLRGIEGLAGRWYFNAFKSLLPPEWGFLRRVKRGCPDAVNAMLSLCYSRLYACVSAQLEFLGFDPWLGFYHEVSEGHRSLASDMMEPFRSELCDRVVLSIFRRNQVKKADIRELPGGKIRLTADVMRLVLTAFQERLFRRRRVGERYLTWLEIIRREGRRLAGFLEDPRMKYDPWRSH